MHSLDGYVLRPLRFPRTACLLWSCSLALDDYGGCRQAISLRGTRWTGIVTALISLRHRPCPRVYPRSGEFGQRADARAKPSAPFWGCLSRSSSTTSAGYTTWGAPSNHRGFPYVMEQQEITVGAACTI